jgi:hypothetical protein
MKPFLLAIGCLAALYSPAQRVIDVEKNDVSGTSNTFFMVVGGQPFVNAKFAKLVEGTPYFSEEWMRGNIIMEGGKQYINVELKLDLLDHELHYKDANGNEMIANSIPQKIVMFDTVAQRIYNFAYYTSLPPSDADKQKGWYLLLGEGGNAAIYKQIIKTMNESKPYGSATVEQSIKTSTRYFVLYKGVLSQVKKIKDIPDILTDKKKELLQFLSTHKLSEKNDSDFEELLQYYSSLK